MAKYGLISELILTCNTQRAYLAICFLVVFLFFVVSCGQQSSNTSVLEGEWADQCTDITSSARGVESAHSVLVFQGNTSATYIYEYSDNNCSVFMGKLKTLGGPINPGSEGINGTFEIGNTVQTSNGVDATELIYHPDHLGSDYTDIFLLQNNNTAVVFGLKCQSPNGFQCEITRPTELNYSRPYSRF